MTEDYFEVKAWILLMLYPNSRSFTAHDVTGTPNLTSAITNYLVLAVNWIGSVLIN